MKSPAARIYLCTAVLVSGWVSAEETEVKTVQGAVYGALNYYHLQVENTVACISDPGIFEGEHTIEFGDGSGIGFTLGAMGEEKWYFAGFEFEFIMSTTDIINNFPAGTIYEDLNSLDQLSLNLNMHLGTDIGDRFFRPYIFGGIGYTEVELVGHYGLAQVGLEEGYADTFGYHAGVGADLRICKGLYLNAGYRYYETTDAEIETRGRTIEFSNSGQMIHIGLSYIHFPPPVKYTTYKEIWNNTTL